VHERLLAVGERDFNLAAILFRNYDPNSEMRVVEDIANGDILRHCKGEKVHAATLGKR